MRTLKRLETENLPENIKEEIHKLQVSENIEDKIEEYRNKDNTPTIVNNYNTYYIIKNSGIINERKKEDEKGILETILSGVGKGADMFATGISDILVEELAPGYINDKNKYKAHIKNKNKESENDEYDNEIQKIKRRILELESKKRR